MEAEANLSLSLKKLQEEMGKFLYTEYPGENQVEWVDQFLSFQTPEEIQIRLKIYRHNLVVTLTQVLCQTFPVVEKIVSKYIFQNISRQYIYTFPAKDHDFNLYGESLPGFLHQHSETAKYPFIFDLAQLEWIWAQCQIVHEERIISAGNFIKKLNADPHKSFFELRRSSLTLATSYSIFELWKSLRTVDDVSKNKDISVEKRQQHLFLWNDNGQRKIHEVEDELVPILSAIHQGKSFAQISQLPNIIHNQKLLMEGLQVMLLRCWIRE